MKKLLVAITIIGMLAFVAIAGDIDSPGKPAPPETLISRIIKAIFG